MFNFKVLIFLAACLPWSYCKLYDYCSLCEDHTMCKYLGLGDSCKDPGDWGVSSEERQEILDVHNWVRRVVASGQETRGLGGVQPQAANLRKLMWDEDLAEVAQRWADQCRFQHDTCRTDPRWYVGQNIFWKWMYPTHPVNWTDAILSWFDEVSEFDPKEIRAYSYEPSTGHYTQLVWHNTYAIGCGRRDYGNEKLYVCNYGPTGNWLGEPVYDIGEPCSSCPKGTECEEFLCVPSEKLTRDISHEMAGRPVLPGLPSLPNRKGQTQEKQKLEKNQSRRNQTDVKFPNRKIPFPLTQRPESGKTEKSGKDIDRDKSRQWSVMDDNEIVLDEKTRKEIEKVHAEIEKLLKMFIKNIRNLRKEEWS